MEMHLRRGKLIFVSIFPSLILRSHLTIGQHCFKQWLVATQIARFVGPIWGPPVSCRSQMGPVLAPIRVVISKPLSASMLAHFAAHICVAGLVWITGGCDDLNVLIWIDILLYHSLYQCGEILCVRRTLPHYCNTFSISSAILINMIEPNFMWNVITISYLNFNGGLAQPSWR